MDLPKIIPTSPKINKLNLSKSDTSDKEDNKFIALSAKEVQDIFDKAIGTADIPKKEKALIKIITTTGNQSPIRERFQNTEQDEKK